MSYLSLKVLTCQVTRSTWASKRLRRCTTRSTTPRTRVALTRFLQRRSASSVHAAENSTLATTWPLTCPMTPTCKSIGALVLRSSSTLVSHSLNQCWRTQSKSLAFASPWAQESCSASTRSNFHRMSPHLLMRARSLIRVSSAFYLSSLKATPLSKLP